MSIPNRGRITKPTIIWTAESGKERIVVRPYASHTTSGVLEFVHESLTTDAMGGTGWRINNLYNTRDSVTLLEERAYDALLDAALDAQQYREVYLRFREMDLGIDGEVRGPFTGLRLTQDTMQVYGPDQDGWQTIANHDSSARATFWTEDGKTWTVCEIAASEGGLEL